MVGNGIAYGFARSIPIASGLVKVAAARVAFYNQTGTVPRISATNKPIRDLAVMQAP